MQHSSTNASPDFEDVPPQRLAAAGFVPTPLDNDADWGLRFSEFDKYLPEDRIDERVYAQIEQRLRTTARTIVIKAGTTAAFVVAAFLAVYFLIFAPDTAPFIVRHIGHPADIVSFALKRWLGVSGSGTPLLLSAAAALIVFALREISLNVELFRQSREYLRSIAQLRAQIAGLRQIYCGSGELRFSYGKWGIRIKSGTIDMGISWHAVAGTPGFTYLLLARKPGDGRRRPDRFEVENDVATATHLLLALKSNAVSDYLLIPAHFFRGKPGATPWEKFVTDLSEFKSRFDAEADKIPD